MNSTRQAARITLLGASAVLALTCTTACGPGSQVERDRAPATQIEVPATESESQPCPPLTAWVELRRSPPTTCGGHPTHPTWAEYRLLQQGW
jgi:hypothetical protein